MACLSNFWSNSSLNWSKRAPIWSQWAPKLCTVLLVLSNCWNKILTWACKTWHGAFGCGIPLSVFVPDGDHYIISGEPARELWELWVEWVDELCSFIFDLFGIQEYPKFIFYLELEGKIVSHRRAPKRSVHRVWLRTLYLSLVAWTKAIGNTA